MSMISYFRKPTSSGLDGPLGEQEWTFMVPVGRSYTEGVTHPDRPGRRTLCWSSRAL